ncbi:MAG: PD-(D/E)XK nuclease family protein [Gemmataceae bacterium]
MSYSKIALYRECPLRFQFRYIHRLPEEMIPSSLLAPTFSNQEVWTRRETRRTGKPAPSVVLRPFVAPCTG